MPHSSATLGPTEWPAASTTTAGAGPAWDALERFIKRLQSGRQTSDQYSTALSAICEATGAAFAFLYSDQTGRVLDLVGDPTPTPGWCRELSMRAAAGLPHGGLWSAPENDHAQALAGGLRPCTAVVLPVGAPQPAMLVAVGLAGNPPLGGDDVRVIRVIWRLQIGQRKHAEAHDNLKETLFGIIRCLSTAIDAKDPCTSGHSERVARMAVRLGEEMKLPRGEISDLYLAGLLHDVGKIGIRDDVLLKDGPLTPDEMAHMREHPVTGDRIVANVTRLHYLRPGVRGHHERFDGKGYPDGLESEAIPLMARILAVADSCDAMMSTRRYRAALSPSRIEEILRGGAGTQWDPRIVDAFLGCRLDLYAVCQRGLGQSVLMAVERAAGSDKNGGQTVLPARR